MVVHQAIAKQEKPTGRLDLSKDVDKPFPVLRAFEYVLPVDAAHHCVVHAGTACISHLSNHSLPVY
jgi:hypothetical protein